ncbi:unnamed protein product [Prorocentrum cordatum]|nr:unnamed protein product [Polarella glacialis]
MTSALLRVLPQPPARARILDFCCGSGSIAAALLQRAAAAGDAGARLHLLDADAVALEVARQGVWEGDRQMSARQAKGAGMGKSRPGGGVPSVEELYEVARGVHEDLDERLLGYTRQFSGEAGASDEAQELGWATAQGASLGSGNSSDIEGMLSNLSTSVSEGISEMRSLEIMACLADSWQVISNIGSIIVNIEALTKACAQPYPQSVEKRTTCASLVTLNLAKWGYLGANICNLISSCPGVFNVEATCALGPIGIFASGSGVANGAATMAGNCKQGLAAPPEGSVSNETMEDLVELEIGGGRRLRTGSGGGAALPDWVGPTDAGASHGTPLGRYAEQLAASSRAMAERGELPTIETVTVDGRELLIPAGASQGEISAVVEAEARRSQDVAPADAPLSSAQKWAIAACVFDTQTMVARFIQAAAFMGFAILDCRKEVFDEFGFGMKKKCVIDIGVMTASLAIASSMISLDIINCPHTLKYMPDNLCASGILQIISSTSYFAVAFASIADACYDLDPNHPEPNTSVRKR